MSKSHISDFWIGDQVRLKKSGRIGVFEGVHISGKARVRIGDKVVLSSAKNMIEVEEERAKPEIPPDLVSERHKSRPFESEIDLHIEKLDIEAKHQLPQMILRKQMTVCKNYIEQAIQLRKPEITVIHGKGRGQLKLEVAALLGSYDEVQYTHLTNEGGATKVGFRY